MTHQEYTTKRQSIFSNNTLTVREKVKRLKDLEEKRKELASKIGQKR